MKRIAIIYYITVIILGVLLLWGCSKEQKTDNLSILFIGNSLTFFNEMPDSLKDMAESKGKELYVDYELTKNGATLKEFWDEGKALEVIRSRDWDYVVLQGQSQEALLHKEQFSSYVKLFDKEIKGNNSKTILYTTSTRGDKGKVDPQQQTINNQAYLEVAKEVGAIIAPVGQAWLQVSKEYPDIKLYAPDNLHPSELGSYMIASVFYGVLFNESPEGSTDKMLSSENKERAPILTKAAWEVVCDFK